MTTDELKRLPHLTASEVGECLRVKTASGWRLTDGVRYCTRLFCALTAELPDYKITDGKETYPTETETETETADTATASDTDEADKAAGESSPAADAAEPDTAAQEDDRVTTAGETATETAETSKGWCAKAWTATCEWCAKAWADACEWCAGVWRKMTNKG